MDLSPLRVSVPYRRMSLGASLSGIGTALTNGVGGLPAYDITGSTAAGGLFTDGMVLYQRSGHST